MRELFEEGGFLGNIFLFCSTQKINLVSGNMKTNVRLCCLLIVPTLRMDYWF